MARLSRVAMVILGVAVAGYFVLTRLPQTASLTESSPAAVAPAGNADETAAAPATPTALATAKIDELNASSETFRNTTFVMAIRSAGYVCDTVVDAYAGDAASGRWRVGCRDMRAYTIGVGDAGELAVEPVLSYFDAQRPFPALDNPSELREQRLREPPR